MHNGGVEDQGAGENCRWLVVDVQNAMSEKTVIRVNEQRDKSAREGEGEGAKKKGVKSQRPSEKRKMEDSKTRVEKGKVQKGKRRANKYNHGDKTTHKIYPIVLRRFARNVRS